MENLGNWPVVDPLLSYGRGRELLGRRHKSLIYGPDFTDVIIIRDSVVSHFLVLILGDLLETQHLGFLEGGWIDWFAVAYTKWCPAPDCEYAVNFDIGSENYVYLASVHIAFAGIKMCFWIYNAQRKLIVQLIVALCQSGF
ncbi:hypothetical protein AHAS_Ahas15G0129700 [Arachis hypogaea]